ncbi:MAG: Gldg family protein [Hyphomonadaceae bacterium]
MSGRRFALIAAFAVLVMFIAGNLISHSWFRGARLDLTESRLYSLSPGTRFVLSPEELSEPITLTFFYARDAAARAPDVQAYAARVREMLQTYQAASRGRIRFVEIDPKPFSEEEDRAVDAGLQPAQTADGGDPIYFGLVGANSIDDKRTIPYFDAAREPFLEYEITRLIYELQNPAPLKVALISTLPLEAGSEGAPGAAPPSTFAQELTRFTQVTRLAPDFTSIPADSSVLAIIHPGALTPAQQYAIDQYILRKGRAFIALDPAAMTAAQDAGMVFLAPPAPTFSSLPALLPRWGVTLSQDVVLDGEAALPVETQNLQGQPAQAPQPLFFHVDPQRMAQGDLMTAPLQRGVNFGMAGALSWSDRPGITVTPLMRTTGATMRMPAEQALQRPSPFELMQTWSPAARIETVALRLSGVLQSAFPNGPPPDAPHAADAARLTRSATPAEIVIVSDVDFLADDFYIDPQHAAPFADNGAFALNAIDMLGGSDALVSLRARAPSVRRMEVIDRMEAEAQRRIVQRQQELQAQLGATEQRLRDLRERGQGSAYFSGDLNAELTPAERAEIDRFTARVAEVRAELRHTRAVLRADIERLQALILFLNMWVAPLLVAGAGLYVFWRRARRARPNQEAGREHAS